MQDQEIVSGKDMRKHYSERFAFHPDGTARSRKEQREFDQRVAIMAKNWSNGLDIWTGLPLSIEGQDEWLRVAIIEDNE